MKACLKQKNRFKRSGFSLVEIMVSLLVLSVLTVGGAAMMMRSGESVAIQENKRAAIEAANRRMELIRSTPSISFNSGAKRFWAYNGATLDQQSSDPRETVEVNGLRMGIRAWTDPVRFSSADYTAVNAFEIVVEVDYRANNESDTIVLKSYYR